MEWPTDFTSSASSAGITGESSIPRPISDKEKQLWLTKWAQHLDKLLKGKQAASTSKHGKKRGQAGGKKS
jgi:hypothetical protein